MGECFFWYWPTRVVPDQRPLNGRCCYYYYYYAAFNAPCVGHKDDESPSGSTAAVSVMTRFEFLSASVCSDFQVASDDVR